MSESTLRIYFPRSVGEPLIICANDEGFDVLDELIERARRGERAAARDGTDERLVVHSLDRWPGDDHETEA